jgi:stage II sporulation protein M
MDYKRNSNKSKNKIFKLIEGHINKNLKEYAISAIVFLIGIIIGIMLINSSSQENKESICGYITEFVDSIKNNEYQIDNTKLLIKSILSNLKIAVIIWISGSTIIGIPLIYGCLGYKGICIGYSISAIIASLGNAKGIALALSSMLLQNIIISTNITSIIIINFI